MTTKAARQGASTCSACSAIWRASGTTNCWSGDPKTAPPRPKHCPAGTHASLIKKTYGAYIAGDEDARLAHAAGLVEGLCYEKTRAGTVTARWTRVEDTIARRS